MKLVAVFLSDDVTVRRLTLAFRTRCAVRHFSDIDTAQHALASGQVLAMVVDIRGRTEQHEQDSIELIAQLHSAWPIVPIVSYVVFTPQRARDIMAAAHAGASELILGDFEEMESIASKIITIGTSKYVTARLSDAIQGIVPEHLHAFFLFCVKNAQSPINVDSVVARLRKSRKTLSNWLMAAHLPPPSRIVGWARILVAARMLEDATQSVEKVARDLHFTNGTALRTMLRRYVDCGPEGLRQRGGFEHALQVFIDSLQAEKATRL